MNDWCQTIVSSPFGSAAHVLKSGRERLIIDTGHPRFAERTLSTLSQSGLLDGTRAIVHTHAHADHTGATALLMRHTGASLFSAKPSLDDKLLGEQQALGLATPRSPDGHCVEDGDSIRIGGERLRVIATPGHSDDHIALFHEKRGALFCGDLFCNNDIGTLDITRYYRSSLELLEKSVSRCAGLGPRLVFPGHGGMPSPAGRLFQRATRRIELFRKHPDFLIAHTLMPLLLLLVESRVTIDIDSITAYTLDHCDFFNGFLDGVSEDVLKRELDKTLVILELKGLLVRTGQAVSLADGRLEYAWAA